MKNLNVVVDKRTELLSIILALSNGNDYIKEHFLLTIPEEYRKEVQSWFSKYKNHRCISLVKKIAAEDYGLSYDNPIKLAFQLDEDLTFKGSIDQDILKELENEKLLIEFLKEVENFAKETNYETFYEHHLNYYNSKIYEIENLFNFNEFNKIIGELLKENVQTDFTINIIPMLTNSNHGFKAGNVNYANIGLNEENFSIQPFNKGYVNIVIHEFLHMFVNPNTDSLKNSIDFVLNEYQSSKLKKIGYNNKFAYINDTIVRALTIRVMQKLANANAEEILKREEQWGFIHIKRIYKQILVYEKQKEQNFSEYFINLINIFNDTSKYQIDF